jgi:hypothetical protein
MSIFKTLRQLRRSIGLEPASAADFILPAVGVLAVGIVAGAAVALLFAPTTGKKLREEMDHKLTDLRSRLMLQERSDARSSHRNNLPQNEPLSHG